MSAPTILVTGASGMLGGAVATTLRDRGARVRAFQRRAIRHLALYWLVTYCCLLNFAPVPVRTPAGVEVRHVDLATELQVLSHFAPSSAEAAGGAQPVPGAAAHSPHPSPGPLEAET